MHNWRLSGINHEGVQSVNKTAERLGLLNKEVQAFLLVLRQSHRLTSYSSHVMLDPWPSMLLSPYDCLRLDRLLKNPVHRLVKKVPNARRARNQLSEAYLGVRRRETVERNAADGPFSTACRRTKND